MDLIAVRHREKARLSAPAVPNASESGLPTSTSGKTHLPCNGKYVLFHKKVARNGFFGMFA